MRETALLVENLGVRMGNKQILEDVSFEVKEGEFWGVIGPNGGGKTTLLRSILGIVRPSKGRVKIFGRDPEKAVAEGLVGYLPQRIEGMVPFTARDFVELVGKDGDRFLELVGMSEKADTPFEKLSGGERQRVLFAAVLSRRPKLLLLDEPHTGVDIVAQDSFYSILRKLKEEGITILMVSHDVGVIVNFVDKIACLNKKLKYTGDPRQALDCNLLEELYGAEMEVFVHHPECEGCHIYRRS